MEIRERPDLSTRREPVAPSSGVGFGRAAAQGAVRGAGMVGDLADLVTRAATKGASVAVPSLGDLGPTGMGEAARGTGRLLLGRQPPRSQMTTGERVVESGVAGAVAALPTSVLPMGTVPSLVSRALLEIGSGATSQIAADLAERAGMGFAGQMAAGVAGGFLPGAVLGVGRRATAAQRAALRAGGAQGEARTAFQQAVGTNVDEARGALAAEASKLGTAPTAAALEDIAPRVKSLERSVLQTGGAGGDTLSNEIVRLRKANERAIEEGVGRLMPGGRAGPAQEAFERARDQLARRVEDAYAAARDLDGIPTAGVKAQLRAIRDEATSQGLDQDVPTSLARVIDKLGEATNLNRLRGLRTRIGERTSQARRAGRNNHARYLTQLKASIDDTLETVARESGAPEVGALRRAISTARDEFRLIGSAEEGGRALGSTRLFLERENLRDGFRQFILGAKRPSDEIGRLRTLIGDDPDAWLGIQGLMRDSVFGEGLENLGKEKAKSLLKRHRSAWDGIFGEGSAANAIEFSDRVRQLRSGVTGTRFEAIPTGSAVPSIHQFAENAGVLANIARGDWGGAAGNALAKVFQRVSATTQESRQLLAGALTDPKIARGFLEPLDANGFAAWERSVKKWMAARVGVRSGLAAQEESQP